MKKKEYGFTLVELIFVIVIIGILSAVAMPKFVDLSSDAKDSVFSGIQGTLLTAEQQNASIRKNFPTKGIKTNGVDCNAIFQQLIIGALPNDYTVSGGTVGGAIGTQFNCTMTQAHRSATIPITILD